jgi:hypothetical protein
LRPLRLCGELKSAVYARVHYMHKRMTFLRLFLANPTLQSGLFGDKMTFHGFIQLAD